MRKGKTFFLSYEKVAKPYGQKKKSTLEKNWCNPSKEQERSKRHQFKKGVHPILKILLLFALLCIIALRVAILNQGNGEQAKWTLKFVSLFFNRRA